MPDGYASFPPELPTDRPAGARIYNAALGGKDHFEVDRAWARGMAEAFPEGLDIARENRLFLYRAVRFLARDLGVRQFLDLGSGLPTENNVHQVAQAFNPDANVVYVDMDPIAAAHGRALLADEMSTVMLEADLRDPDAVVDHPETRRLIDFTQPVAVLLFSVPHNISDDAAARLAIQGPMNRVVPGSFLAISHVVADDLAIAREHTASTVELGLDWKTRLPGEFEAWLEGLEPVAPGLVEVTRWRPDPDQPTLSPVDPEFASLQGASHASKRVYEYGGVLRKS